MECQHRKGIPRKEVEVVGLQQIVTNRINQFICTIKKHPVIVLGVLCAFCTLLVVAEANATVVFAVGFSLIFVSGLYLFHKNKLDYRAVIMLLFAVGFLLRLQYILYTGCMERQHDVEVFGEGYGHSGYIEYIFSEFKLPYFDVRDVWQFYHPPLHHIISAVFLKILTLCGLKYNLALESLQLLTLFYSSLCMLISYRIISEFGIRGKAAVATFAITVFHPTFIIFAGSINNDILSITFQLAAILYTLRWYKSRHLSDIIKIALCVGLGMMTKLSAWMVAPAIAMVFLYALISDLKEGRRRFSFYLRQYSIFAAFCLPLGLWWSIRNYLLHSVPPTYIPFLDTNNPQYIGYHSIFKRFFDFSAYQFSSVFDQWGEPYYEFNPGIGLLKTSMFGESINDSAYPQISVFGSALFWTGTALAVLSLGYMLYTFLNRRIKKDVNDVFFLIMYAVIFVMYYYFCVAYPFTCTQNIRYATPLILIGSLYIGRWLMKARDNLGKGTGIVSHSLYSLVGLYCIFSTATYVLLGI